MIQTRSSFFTLDPVDSTNFYLDFNEGSGELTAEVEVGSYTMTDIIDAIEAAMNAVGTQAYTVTFDRDARKFTISATNPFSLLVSTGTHVGNDIFSLIGFTGADRPSGTSHLANLQAGTEYVPQFWLQDFVDPLNFQKAISSTVSKTTSGDVEVVKFGIEKFYEFSIKLVTNISQGGSGFVEDDPSGVENLRAFLVFCTNKSNLEFMPDRDDKNVFFKILLESTEQEKDGTGFKIKELYDSGLPGFFESGKLTFRLRE